MQLSDRNGVAMQQYPRAHALRSLAVALLAAHGADQKILADVECTLVWTNGPFVWSQRPFRPIGDPSRPEVP